MLGTTLGLFALSITATVLMYVFFVPDASDCSHNVAFITVNIIFGILFTLISIHPKVTVALSELNEIDVSAGARTQSKVRIDSTLSDCRLHYLSRLQCSHEVLIDFS